jgi:hypothetical protein
MMCKHVNIAEKNDNIVWPNILHNITLSFHLIYEYAYHSWVIAAYKYAKVNKAWFPTSYTHAQCSETEGIFQN